MRILIASEIDATAVALLSAAHDVCYAPGANAQRLRELIPDREVLVFRSGVTIDADLLARAPALRLIVRAGCGLDNLALDAVEARGIQLTRIPQPGAIAVAEMTLALMLSLARNVGEADRKWRQGKWVKSEIEGHLLNGKVLGIVGAGNIGSRLGEIAAHIGMRSIGCVEHYTTSVAQQLAARGIRLTTFDEVIQEADYLSINVPLTEATRHMINADVLRRMKSGAYLINMARGGVVDESALREALVRGRLKGAALDVHEREGNGHVSPLADLPNVLLTPHIGAMTVETQHDIGQRVVQIINSFLAGQPEIEVAEAVAVHGAFIVGDGSNSALGGQS